MAVRVVGDELIDTPEDTPEVQSTSQEVPTEVAAAADGSITAMLRAKRADLEKRSKKFAVPPFDIWGDDLVIEVLPISIKQNMKNVAFIERCTGSLLARDPESGQLVGIANGWRGFGEIMGFSGPDVSTGQIIKKACTSDEVVGALTVQILAWIAGRAPQIEETLGE